MTFYEADIRDKEALEKIFSKEEINSCIHFCPYGFVISPFGHSSVIGRNAGFPYTVAEEENTIFLGRL